MSFNDLELKSANIIIGKAINVHNKILRFKETLSKISLDNPTWAKFQGIPDIDISNVPDGIKERIIQSNLEALHIYKLKVLENRIELYKEAIMSTEAIFSEVTSITYIEETLLTMLPAYIITNTIENIKHERIIYLREYILNSIHSRIKALSFHSNEHAKMDVSTNSSLSNDQLRLSTLEQKMDQLLLCFQKPKKDFTPELSQRRKGVNTTQRSISSQQPRSVNKSAVQHTASQQTSDHSTTSSTNSFQQKRKPKVNSSGQKKKSMTKR